MRMKTMSIAGHELTLIEGVRYIASRPMAPPRGARIAVTIEPMPGEPEVEAVRVRGLTYEQSNDLLSAFNNGPTSFDGRVW